jgi:uncharacterized protein (DUF2267 family)
MKYDEMIGRLRKEAGLEREDAERTLLFVLQSLVDRITGDEADDLVSQLPQELKMAITITPDAEPMASTEFVTLVAGELGVEEEEARRRINAVFHVLKDAVTPGEYHDVLVQLPSGIAELALT